MFGVINKPEKIARIREGLIAMQQADHLRFVRRGGIEFLSMVDAAIKNNTPLRPYEHEWPMVDEILGTTEEA